MLEARKQDHVSPLLRSLHWLPVQSRIECKLSTLCHLFFLPVVVGGGDGGGGLLLLLLLLLQPLFICLICFMCTLHQDRSAHLLTQDLYAFHTFRHRFSSYGAPSVSNSLSRQIRHIKSTSAFQPALMTHLFNNSYNKLLPPTTQPTPYSFKLFSFLNCFS